MRNAGITTTPGDARAYCEETIGWVIDAPNFTRNGQTYPCRTTCIFHAEGEDWKIVRQHFSFGVPIEEVEVFKDVTAAPWRGNTIMQCWHIMGERGFSCDVPRLVLRRVPPRAGGEYKIPGR